MIIKETEKRLRESRKRLEGLEENSQSYRDEYLKSCAYKKVFDFIRFGGWCKRPTYRERVIMAVSKGIKFTSNHYSTSANSIKSSVYNANVKIQETISFDVLSEIEEGNIQDAMALFELRTSGTAVDNILPEYLYEYLPNEWGYHKLNREALLSALKTLRSLEKMNLVRELKKCDDKTLSCIFHILSSKERKWVSLQGLFYSFITDGLSESALVERLSEIK